ncbi:MAG: hypothetical protein KBG62_02860 [Propionivibrio sp.]|nr:hypothetical protein [Propionivibrio sp.]
MKSLDDKLARIRAGEYRPNDFIIADAKDADMAFGMMAPGLVRDQHGNFGGEFAPRSDYLQAMRNMTRSGFVDIMLMSASSAEILGNEGCFSASTVTPAVRYNDTTDIWHPRGGRYGTEPARPFRTARLHRVRRFADLGLYSITFSNHLERDLAMLEAYAAFREEAAELGMRHFLEVFNPAFDVGVPAQDLGLYIADAIVRALAGVVSSEHPLFLKIAYNGRYALSRLASYAPQNMIVGILGGSRGTTRDAFELISRAEQAGARVALFGRKINLAQHPLELVRLLRAVVSHEVTAQEAVKLYHHALHQAGIRPMLGLEDDLAITDPVLLAED